jgi:ubiquinone/menaquinone biosynthesis C-methylase UbiE
MMATPFSRASNPQMGDEFAAAYEATAHRITGPISEAALDLLDVGVGAKVLDIAAGAGALSGPAAERGAHVLAIDVAPGMVRRLAERLRPFAHCQAREMDGEQLDIADRSFDVAFSIFGVILFDDWRKGLREQARVLRQGGRACVAAWKEPPGGGPFVAMGAALRSVFPDQSPPHLPEGMRVLSDPKQLQDEMHAAGLASVEIHEIEGIWRSGVGDAYLADTERLYEFMQPFAGLDAKDQDRVRAALRSYVDEHSQSDAIEFRTPVLVAVGARR